MRRPRKVHHIDGTEAKLRWPKQCVADGDRNAGGWYEIKTGNISISTSHPPADQAEYLLHELMHHIKPPLKHKVIYWLSERMVMWIRANPSLARWIVESALKGEYHPRKENAHVDIHQARRKPPVDR